MADSIQEKITTLQRYNDRMEFELSMSGEVQQIIFPHIEQNNYFDYAVFHKAFGKVSGDYYDVFKLDKSKYGFLIVDVSGHGVPAALITMIAKEKFRTLAPHYCDPAELFKYVLC
jgi:sigma-B regulation protein RsbU (phosphoserine phosphatase)